MADIRETLGELYPLYEEYREVVLTAPDEPHFVEFRPEIKLDKKKEGEEVSGVEHALTKAGFAT